MSAITTNAGRIGPSFASALWVTGALLRLVMVSVMTVLLFIQPQIVWPYALIIIADLFVFAFQALRFASASSFFLQQTGRFWTVTAASLGFGAVALGTMFLWWLAFVEIENIIDRNANQSNDRTRSQPGIHDTRKAPKRFRMHLSLDGRTLTYDGVMASGMMDDLGPVLATARDLEQVVLNSPGGNLYEARRFAQRVLQYGLDTHVMMECSSSCLLAFTAGANRTLGPGAKLGFHRYGLDFKQLMPFADVQTERLQDQSFFEQQLVSQEFIDRYFRTERRALWYPHRTELFDAGILTKQ